MHLGSWLSARAVSLEYVVGSGFGHDIKVIRISHTGQATFDGSGSWAVTLHLVHL